MDFSSALESIKTGSKVQRSGWNGKGMFLFLVQGGEFEHPSIEGKVEALPYIAMKTVQGSVVPWLASQTDILADDWSILLDA